MKIAIYLNGIPSAEKESFIKNNRLQDFLISKADLRVLYSGYVYDKNGNKTPDTKNDDKVEGLIYNIIENKMQKGELIVFDPEGPNIDNINRFKRVLKKYGYKGYVVDFNANTGKYESIKDDQMKGSKSIGANAMNNLYTKARKLNRTQSGLKVINPHDIKKLYYQPVDLSEYKKVHHIGDIHGSYTKLINRIGDIQKDHFYIFHGDYIDRGPENAEMIEYLYKIKDLDNVVLLRGNHEASLSLHEKGLKLRSKQYIEKTKDEIESISDWKKKINLINSSLLDMFSYFYADAQFIASHGGISTYTDNLNKISSECFVYGSGNQFEAQSVADSFSQSVGDRHIYQIFGHRSDENIDKQNRVWISSKSFNLNGDPEIPEGSLQSMTISKKKMNGSIRIKNKLFVRIEK